MHKIECILWERIGENVMTLHSEIGHRKRSEETWFEVHRHHLSTRAYPPAEPASNRSTSGSQL
jgi:hypothetical protein